MTKEELKDLKSVINFLEGSVDKRKIINYIRKYLLKENND